MPASRAIEADRAGGVAGEDDDLDALLDEVGDGGRRVAAGAPRPVRRDRAAAAGAARRRGRPGTARSPMPNPTTRRPASCWAAAGRRQLLEREELRRAEDVADTADPQAAPAAAGEERDRLVDRLRRRRRGTREGRERQVPRLGRRREAAERLVELRPRRRRRPEAARRRGGEASSASPSCRRRSCRRTRATRSRSAAATAHPPRAMRSAAAA